MSETVFIGRRQRDALVQSRRLFFPLPDRPGHYSDGERDYWVVDQDSYGPIVATIPDARAGPIFGRWGGGNESLA